MEPAFARLDDSHPGGTPAGKPDEPIEPLEPVELFEPDEPVEPLELLEPVEPPEPLEPPEPVEPREPTFARLDDSDSGGAPAGRPPEPLAVFGPEQLTRLRARYAELLARITERGGSPERIDALRTQALPLNPDGWVTDAEVRAGIEGFETRMRDLRSALGLRRRRRSRRGGRRRKPDSPPTPKPEV